MPSGEFTSYDRRLPHWRLSGATYFLTFRTKVTVLSDAELRMVREHIVAGHLRFYELIGVVVMPDHTHALLTPMAGYELSRITKGIKGVSARQLNEARVMSGSVWQDESWDRIVRDQSELDEKLRYMLDNPVRQGLTEDPWTWPGWWCGTNG